MHQPFQTNHVVQLDNAAAYSTVHEIIVAESDYHQCGEIGGGQLRCVTGSGVC